MTPLKTTPLKTARLKIDIHSYWYQGTGKGSGSHLDALVEKDQKGLPFVNGKMLKGLLRDACNRLAIWNSYDLESYQLESYQLKSTDKIVETLFGSSGFANTKQGNVARDETQAGLLRFSDATLPTEIAHYLADKPHQALRNKLYTSLYSTAIQHKSGVAKEGSLRGMEVTIPMILEAQIELFKMPTTKHHSIEQQAIADNWQAIIKTALPLIRHVGGQRNRGLGRATLTLEDAT